MKKLQKNLISSFVFLLLIALTAANYYLLPYEKQPIDKLALFCVIASEAIALAGMLFYNTVSCKKKLALTAGGYTVLFGYLVLSVIASMLFTFCYRQAVAAYEIVFVSLTGVFLISSVLVIALGQKLADHACDVDHACHFFKELECKAEKLCSVDCPDRIRSELQKISDAVANCDHSVCVDTDSQISDSITCLLEQVNARETDSGKLLETCENTMRLIQQRNAEVCRLKVGGI